MSSAVLTTLNSVATKGEEGSVNQESTIDPIFNGIANPNNNPFIPATGTTSAISDNLEFPDQTCKSTEAPKKVPKHFTMSKELKNYILNVRLGNDEESFEFLKDFWKKIVYLASGEFTDFPIELLNSPQLQDPSNSPTIELVNYQYLKDLEYTYNIKAKILSGNIIKVNDDTVDLLLFDMEGEKFPIKVENKNINLHSLRNNQQISLELLEINNKLYFSFRKLLKRRVSKEKIQEKINNIKERYSFD